MQATLTANLVKKSTPKDKPYEIWDTDLKGFILRVQPSGRKMFLVEYARHKRIGIGPVTAWTAARAREKAREYIHAYLDGNDPMKEKKAGREHTLKSYIEEKYQPWAESHLKSPTKFLHLIGRCYPELGDKKLSDITPFLFEKHRTRRLREGLTGATTNRTLAALKAALNKAVEWRILKVNPLAAVKRMREDANAVIRYLSADEERRLRAALDAREARRRQKRQDFNQWRQERGYATLPEFGSFTDHLKPMVLLALNTGCRRGELFNLKWTDTNFVTRMLTVVGRTAKSGKTRHIPLNDEAFEVLQKWHAQRTESEFVFPSHDGGRLDNISTSWDRLVKDAKIENFRFHDLRHDFASKLVMAGIDLNTVRELLGHSDIKMTLRYAHLAPQKLAAAVATLNR